MWIFPQPVQAYVPNQEIPQLVEAEPPANDGRGILQPEQILPPKVDESRAKITTGTRPSNRRSIRKSASGNSGRDNSKSYSKEANGEIQSAMREKVIARWGEEYWSAALYLLDHESGSNPKAVNPKSGACGIPQALPCSKLLNIIGSLDNINGQLDWMINYIAQRYGDPIKAKAFHQSHNWY